MVITVTDKDGISYLHGIEIRSLYLQNEKLIINSTRKKSKQFELIFTNSESAIMYKEQIEKYILENENIEIYCREFKY